MKRLAVFTDLHADVHALRDALVQIDLLGCEAVVCAGDLVDYGVFPEETLGLLVDRGIPCIRGNHDRWAANNAHRFAQEWEMSSRTMRFLCGLPLSLTIDMEGVRVAVWHARPHDDMNGIYPEIAESDAVALLDAAACDVLVVGHTHLAFERRTAGGRMICNPGALLRDPAEPLDIQAVGFRREGSLLVPGDTGAAPSPPIVGTFGVLELPSKVFTVRSARTGEVVPL